MSLQSQRSTAGIGPSPGYFNIVCPSDSIYAPYGSNYRTGSGYGSTGYVSRINERSWLYGDNQYKAKGQGNGFYGYNNENLDGLNELNRGPTARGLKNQKVATLSDLAAKGQDISSDIDTGNKDNSSAKSERKQYNRKDFPVKYT